MNYVHKLNTNTVILAKRDQNGQTNVVLKLKKRTFAIYKGLPS